MNIELKQVIPVPLKDKLSGRQSDIWNTSRSFGQQQWIKIIAPRGTGKTTLVHTLYKLRQNYEGHVTWGVVSLNNITGDDLALLRQQKVSIIFQDLRLFPNLTASENIELNRVLQQPFYESSMIEEMAAQLGVGHILQQQAGLCSYGEQQRIAIIRALVQPFEWLIMDEPFSHLDKANTAKAVALINSECRKRKAGLIITDLDEDNHFAYTHAFTL
jgi:putative ABC transport system ATP-binding protein